MTINDDTTTTTTTTTTITSSSTTTTTTATTTTIATTNNNNNNTGVRERMRGWRNTVEIVPVEISNSKSELRLVTVLFEPKQLDEVSMYSYYMYGHFTIISPTANSKYNLS